MVVNDSCHSLGSDAIIDRDWQAPIALGSSGDVHPVSRASSPLLDTADLLPESGVVGKEQDSIAYALEPIHFL